jgi:hypothetical protein
VLSSGEIKTSRNFFKRFVKDTEQSRQLATDTLAGLHQRILLTIFTLFLVTLIAILAIVAKWPIDYLAI